MRTDILNDGAYELSWTVAPEARGKGIGKAMLVQFKQEVLPEARIVATIQDGNVASEKIAQALGLAKAEPAEHPGFSVWRSTSDASETGQ